LERRICSNEYFNRYFSYAIIANDISDQQVESFLLQTESDSVENITLALKKLVKPQNADKFLWKVNRRLERIPHHSCSKLAISIARSHDLFPQKTSPFPFENPFLQASLTIRHLAEKVSTADDRCELAKGIITESKDITFAFESFRNMVAIDKKSDRILSNEQEKQLRKILAQRVRSVAQDTILYHKYPDYAARLLYVWAKSLSKQETDQYIQKSLQGDEAPKNAVDLLKCYPAKTISSSEPRFIDDFNRDNYTFLSEIVDPEIIYQALHQIYGEELDTKEYPQRYARETNIDLRIAQQFTYIHRQKDAENPPPH
jgi:hypothetical protein